MTLEDIQAMDDYHFAPVVARACGLTLCENALHGQTGHTVDGVTWEALPSYTSDLNAMHEAEKGMSETEKEAYLFDYLPRVVLQESWVCPQERTNQWPSYVTATARQRAEAFVLTMQK